MQSIVVLMNENQNLETKKAACREESDWAGVTSLNLKG